MAGLIPSLNLLKAAPLWVNPLGHLLGRRGCPTGGLIQADRLIGVPPQKMLRVRHPGSVIKLLNFQERADQLCGDQPCRVPEVSSPGHGSGTSGCHSPKAHHHRQHPSCASRTSWCAPVEWSKFWWSWGRPARAARRERLRPPDVHVAAYNRDWGPGRVLSCLNHGGDTLPSSWAWRLVHAHQRRSATAKFCAAVSGPNASGLADVALRRLWPTAALTIAVVLYRQLLKRTHVSSSAP